MSIYTLSRTPFFVVWLILNLLGFFGGINSNLINIYSLFLVFYIIGPSILFFIFCNLKKTKEWAVSVVGAPFLKRFLPVSNFMILLYPIYIFVIIEIYSMQYQKYIKSQECNELFQDGLYFYFFDVGYIKSGKEGLKKHL